MNLAIQKTPQFHADVLKQFGWFYDEAGEELAWRFFNAVDQTLYCLADQPDLGRRRRFRHPALAGIRSFRVEPPFQKILIFYRHNATELFAERLLHGARDLPRRLVETVP